ncbi:hypothetical protein [Alkalibacillus almallahensis]|uniref:hypothetical protein n=1 Tax=Alkalibacillus almallahensis TaxID=1379154 RepID=UPI001422FB98|nr:hypothetical protein [Alkalibacillus almallahensis]NIK13437.1 hypothetical protein [Alkalibacillus almallahensis]
MSIIETTSILYILISAILILINLNKPKIVLYPLLIAFFFPMLYFIMLFTNYWWSIPVYTASSITVLICWLIAFFANAEYKAENENKD